MREDLKKIAKKKKIEIEEILDNKNLRKAFFNNRSLMFGFIKSDFTIYKTSKSMSDCLGYKNNELEGKSILDFSELSQLEKDLPIYRYMIENNKSSFFMHPAKYINKKGEVFQVQCLEPIFIKEKNLWLLSSYLIENGAKGITVLTDRYQKFINDRD